MARPASITTAAPPGPIEDVRRPHTTSTKLEDQAATAALYVTNQHSAAKKGREFLDGNNKLSSAGAASSLKYANPQDLPSYPSKGLMHGDSAANTAATLGWANQKTFEHWKPDPSASASAAAIVAKDYKMAPLWQPEQSMNGAKAALLAHRDGGKVEIWKPEANSWGNSAANQAFQKYSAGTLSPQLGDGNSALGRQGSLLAATGAMTSSRKRAESTPIAPSKLYAYPDQSNSTSNALRAATSASRSAKLHSISAEGGAVPYTTMSRDMYTSHPPVKPEVDEQNRQDILRASAIAMAKSMYNIQQKQIDAASNAQQGAMAAHHRPSSSSAADEVPPMRFNNLQEAAQKLAQERLSRMDDEQTKNREYRDYYGSSSKPQLSRLSIRGRTRRRASSDGNLDEDREQSNKIRAQMSIFSSSVSQIDTKKRQADREALIAAAQRNVTKSLHSMDKKVFADTGNVAPSLLSEWEVKAHAAAQAKSNDRMENYGKVDIGGGKFVSQSAINLVAARNVQPILDDINEKAEKERERLATLKLDQENRAKKATEDKAKEREEKENKKKIHREDKEAKKVREAEEKAAKSEEKRHGKEHRKSFKPESTPITDPTAEPTTTEPTTTEPLATETAKTAVTSPPVPQLNTIAGRREVTTSPAQIRTGIEDRASSPAQELTDPARKDESTKISPISSTGGHNRVKSWLKTKISRRLSRGQKSPHERGKIQNGGFIGGAVHTSSANSSTTSLPRPMSSSKIVAPATTGPPNGSGALHGGDADKRRASQVSSLSSGYARASGDEDEFQEARDNFDEDLAPPRAFVATKSSSPARDSRFSEAL